MRKGSNQRFSFTSIYSGKVSNFSTVVAFLPIGRARIGVWIRITASAACFWLNVLTTFFLIVFITKFASKRLSSPVIIHFFVRHIVCLFNFFSCFPHINKSCSNKSGFLKLRVLSLLLFVATIIFCLTSFFSICTFTFTSLM